MVWNFNTELKVYKELKAKAIMPLEGCGYCIEVLLDGSGFLRIDFLDIDHRTQVMCEIASERRIAAVFCNMQTSDLCGFTGNYLYIEERFSTGKIFSFDEHDRLMLNLDKIDKKRLRIELIQLAESLTKEQIHKGFA